LHSAQGVPPVSTGFRLTETLARQARPNRIID